MVHVVKVGGSLCDWPLLPQYLAEWLDARADSVTLLVAGGGAVADFVRAAEPRWSVSPETSHAAALDAMRVVATLVAGTLDRHLRRPLLRAASWSELLATLELARRAAASNPPPVIVVDLGGILHACETAAASPLVERSWRVTSDSLAAWLASRLETHGLGPLQLTLLKSASAPPASSPPHWQAAGLVDEAFLEYAAGLGTIRIENLRQFAAGTRSN